MTGKTRKRHGPDQIVQKLQDADRLLNAGKSLGEVLQTLEVSEATYHRWRNQYGGKQSQPPSDQRGRSLTAVVFV